MTDQQLFDLVLGALVHHRRKAKKLTQVALGKRLGLSQSTVARIEAGTTSVPASMISHLARIWATDGYDFMTTVHATIKLVRRAAAAISRDALGRVEDPSGLVHFVVAARGGR